MEFFWNFLYGDRQMTYSGKFECKSSSLISNITNTSTMTNLSSSFNILETVLGLGSSYQCHSLTNFHSVNNCIGLLNLICLERTQNFFSFRGSIRYTNQTGPTSRIGTFISYEGSNTPSSTALSLNNSGLNSVTLIRDGGTSISNTIVSNGFTSIIFALKD
jgi:hypothetical protein